MGKAKRHTIMYKGYNLKVNIKEDDVFWSYHNTGKQLYQDNLKQIGKTFKSFLEKDGTIDGSKMQENWFPQYNFDVFISHSHDDEDLAIFLSGWLKKHGITSFIDSCLWGYSNDLLKEIDSTYSWLDINKSAYAYDKVNYSSSHIHMMLSNALAMMIDKSECFIFLNTPKSVVPFFEMDKTKSPWIYSEIILSKLIEKKPPNRPRRITETFSNFSGEEKLEIKYNLDLAHLTILDYSMFFEKWGKKKYASKNEALDSLYGE
jgi:hypothetical protein